MHELTNLDDRGTVTAEYITILVTVTLLCCISVVSLGPMLVCTFAAQVTWLLLPFP